MLKRTYFVILVMVLAIFTSLLSNAQQLNNGKLVFNLKDSVLSTTMQVDAAITAKVNRLDYETTPGEAKLSSQAVAIPLLKWGEFVSFGISIEHSSFSGITLVEVRTADSLLTWEDWFTVEQTDLIAKEDNQFRSELYFLDNKVRYIQFKLTLTGSAADSITLNDVRIFFSSPLPKNEGEDKLEEETDGVGSSMESYPRPDYVDRKGWGCPQAENTTERELTNVTHLIIHHSAGSTAASDYAAIVLSYWDYHVNGNGWDDIGYNWLVDPNGVIYKGRAWFTASQENVKGAHNTGKNAGTAGICLIGDYVDDVIPTSNTWNASWDLLAYLCDRYGLNPLGTSYHAILGKDNDVITGHRDSGGGTECPGDIANSYGAIRQAVADKLDGSFGPMPLDMHTQVSGCADMSVAFSWRNAGSAWQIHLADDPSFNTYYVKWVSWLTDYTGPDGFVLASQETSPLENFEEGQRYFWRIAYGQHNSITSSFTMPDCGPSLLEHSEQNFSAFTVYPNPSNGLFKLAFNTNYQDVKKATLMNAAGQKIFEKQSLASEISFDQQQLNPGVYFLLIETETSSEISKVLIQK